MEERLTATLPVTTRLALSYAPRRARAPTLAIMALDARLAGVVRLATEPILGQLRLAWWRDLLEKPVSAWPAGEPLLELLPCWKDRHGALVALVDGWEGLIGEAPLSSEAFTALADARGQGFAALADLLGKPEAARNAARMACNAALADLAGNVSHPEERRRLAELAHARDWRPTALPHELRPLFVLHGLAARQVRRGRSEARGPGDLFLAVRLGLFGR